MRRTWSGWRGRASFEGSRSRRSPRPGRSAVRRGDRLGPALEHLLVDRRPLSLEAAVASLALVRVLEQVPLPALVPLPGPVRTVSGVACGHGRSEGRVPAHHRALGRLLQRRPRCAHGPDAADAAAFGGHGPGLHRLRVCPGPRADRRSPGGASGGRPGGGHLGAGALRAPGESGCSGDVLVHGLAALRRANYAPRGAA
jgi:hypothetical protein